jgi:hypothetical protein
MMQATASQKGVGLEVGVESAIPFVHGDPDRILEVLINLLENAIKFTPADGAVTVQACRVPTDPDFISISVSDTGSGIAPEARSLIFERLYQDPKVADNNRKGLGLGLFIAKELVTLHGGRIWVASDGASGSTFSFTLPLYSLPKLLFPVIAHENQLRTAIVLIALKLQSRFKPPRGNWKEVCKQGRELLERCVYLDKDLVLPPMASTGPQQTLFVVASTDMERVQIMISRIRGQMEKLEDLKAQGTFEISAREVPVGDLAGKPLEQQVQSVADRVTESSQSILASQAHHAGKSVDRKN